MFSALSKAGGKAFSNMAVGYNNVDVNAANKYGVAVGNTPVSFLFYLLKCLIQILQKVKLNEPSPRFMISFINHKFSPNSCSIIFHTKFGFIPSNSFLILAMGFKMKDSFHYTLL